MEEQSRTLVKLYVETFEDAEATAETLRSEGFGATIGRPLVGFTWSIEVTGEEPCLQGLAERIQREMQESD